MFFLKLPTLAGNATTTMTGVCVTIIKYSAYIPGFKRKKNNNNNLRVSKGCLH